MFDRKSKRLVEETIDGKIVLSMRAIYQSKVGLTLIDAGLTLSVFSFNKILRVCLSLKPEFQLLNIQQRYDIIPNLIFQHICDG